MNTPPASPTEDDLRAGLRVSWVSVAWTLIASIAAIGAGLTDRSLVLVVFGLTGLLDAAGSLTLALHFRHALANEGMSSTRERLALRIVSGGLLAIGVSTAIESVRRLITGARGHHSLVGIVIAATSAVLLAGFTVWKRSVAERVESDALLADSWLSATGAGLAVLAVIGTTLESGTGLSWIDPVAALVIAMIAAVSGVITIRREELVLLRPRQDRSP